MVGNSKFMLHWFAIWLGEPITLRVISLHQDNHLANKLEEQIEFKLCTVGEVTRISYNQYPSRELVFVLLISP